MIKIRSVTRRFQEADQFHDVLRGVDATIAAGEVVALLGRSGSGKSTLLNLISGIDHPDSGTIHIDGVELHRANERERTLFRRHRIGFVFQFFNLIPTLTVLENLQLPLELIGVSTAESTKRARQMLSRVGLGSRGDSYPDKLSGGEQQRVSIARALIHEPSLILADEPTGNLDQETGLAILDLLDELVRDANKTMILVTHSREVARRADRMVAMREGKLVAVSDSELG